MSNVQLSSSQRFVYCDEVRIKSINSQLNRLAKRNWHTKDCIASRNTRNNINREFGFEFTKEQTCRQIFNALAEYSKNNKLQSRYAPYFWEHRVVAVAKYISE